MASRLIIKEIDLNFWQMVNENALTAFHETLALPEP